MYTGPEMLRTYRHLVPMNLVQDNLLSDNVNRGHYATLPHFTI
jgi:hypothetical protein